MTMFLVGSGPSDALGVVYDAFSAEVTKRGGGRIAIALLGSQADSADQLEPYAAPLASRLPNASMEPIWLTEEDEGPTIWPADPEQLAGFVVAGGWAPAYLEALGPKRDLLAKLIRSGVPYLGFSAGASITSKYAIVGGWKYQGRQVAPERRGEGNTELVIREGLGLIGPAVETHADSSSIITRAMAALVAGQMSSVVAIDEDTCLVVDQASGRTSILGAGQVAWVSLDDKQFVVRPQAAAKN